MATILDASPRPTAFPTGGYDESLSLVDLFLQDQQRLTVVEEFSRWHDAEPLPQAPRNYSSLIPLTTPGPGEQYAFDVQLDLCSGCKACVTACHSMNGLDEEETWRDVGLLHGGPPEEPWLQHVTSACHHCIDPACLNVCPAQAYEKDPVTGIVAHLDDQCIGCQYCMLACPYDVPKYNAHRGIVRKCDMCRQRLAVDEPPACVQACPQAAIRVTVVNRLEVATEKRAGRFLPGAPDPALTLPTTVYRSQQPLPADLQSANRHAVEPEHAHGSLIAMLVLSQLATGLLWLDFLAGWTIDDLESSPLRRWVVALAAVFGTAAAATSTGHLGRPLYGFRALLGWRTSWLSREVLAFGLMIPASLACALLPGMSDVFPVAPGIINGLYFAALAGGALVLYCSANVYQCTRRPFWETPATLLKFVLTAAVLGSATILVLQILQPGGLGEKYNPFVDLLSVRLWANLLMVTTLCKLISEAVVFRHIRNDDPQGQGGSARLLAGVLAPWLGARIACALIGGLLLPAVLVRLSAGMSVGAISPEMQIGFIPVAVTLWGLCLVGELLERTLFFKAALRFRMPGGLPF